MSRYRRRPPIVNIPSGPNTGSGAVYLEGEFPAFRLRCTVRGCRWRATEEWHHDAQVVAFAHAAEHQWPKQQKMPLLPPPPRLMRDIFRPRPDSQQAPPPDDD